MMNIMKMGQRVFMQSVRPIVKENKPFAQMDNSTRNHHLIRQMRRPGRGLIFLVSFLTYLIGIFPSLIYALPTNGSVQAGSATINQVSDSRLNISQSSDKSIIDWSSFSIAGGGACQFSSTICNFSNFESRDRERSIFNIREVNIKRKPNVDKPQRYSFWEWSGN